MKRCDYCQGTGYVNELDGDGYLGNVTCPDCNGTGKVYDPDDPDHERP